MFRPLTSRRTPSSSWFAEVFQLAGPQFVGDIGTGSDEERFGWNWIALVDRDRVPRAYQESKSEPGTWVEQFDELPPVFGVPLPVGARRLTGAFGQAGRLNVAYELNQVIYVTRWDAAQNQYVQNVEFDGTDPAMVFDMLAGAEQGESDLVLFYHPIVAGERDNSVIEHRVQRDIFSIPYESWTAGVGEPDVILDRVFASGFRLHLFISDINGGAMLDGNGDLQILQTDFYPINIRPRDPVMTRHRVGDAFLRLTTFSAQPVDPVLTKHMIINPAPGLSEPVTTYTPGVAYPEILVGTPVSVLTGITSEAGDECTNTPISTPLPAEAIGEVDNPFATPPESNFDVVLANDDMLGVLYGVRQIRATFEVIWSARHGLTPGDARRWTPRTPPATGCVRDSTWSDGKRRIILEVAQSPTADVDDALVWHQLGNWFEDAPVRAAGGTGRPVAETRKYTVVAPLPKLLVDPLASFVLVRVRSVAAAPLNNTWVFLKGGARVVLDALTTAHVGSTVKYELSDAIFTTHRVMNNTFISSIARAAVDDAVFTTHGVTDEAFIKTTSRHGLEDSVFTTHRVLDAKFKKTS